MGACAVIIGANSLLPICHMQRKKTEANDAHLYLISQAVKVKLEH
jgi:hypothetical protein